MLETRTDALGIIKRERLREDGLKFTTVEIPVEIWNDYFTSAQRGKNRMVAWLKKRERTAQKLRAQELFAKGWKLAAIASEVKIPERTLSDMRNKWRVNAVR